MHRNEMNGHALEDDIPEFLKKGKGTMVKATDDEEVTEAEAETEAPAPKPAKAKAKKTVKKVATKPNGNGKVHAKPKGMRQVHALTDPDKRTKAPKAAKAAKGVARDRDPATLDAFGFRKGSIKSKAASIYAKGKGATLAEVKQQVGSVQFNLLKELEGRGFEIERSQTKTDGPRKVTRYKLRAKEASKAVAK